MYMHIGTKMRSVLVVDDNIVQRMVCKRLLTQLDAVTIEAPDALVALEVIEDPKIKVEAIITDFHMPKMNGFLLATTLRSKSCRLPIFLSTSDTDIVTQFSTNPAYRIFDGILPKPVIPEDLLDKISRALQRRELEPAILELTT
jgi:CheY-like chemotaxis protein